MSDRSRQTTPARLTLNAEPCHTVAWVNPNTGDTAPALSTYAGPQTVAEALEWVEGHCRAVGPVTLPQIDAWLFDQLPGWGNDGRVGAGYGLRCDLSVVLQTLVTQGRVALEIDSEGTAVFSAGGTFVADAHGRLAVHLAGEVEA